MLLVASCGSEASSAVSDGGLGEGGASGPTANAKKACYAAAKASDAGLSAEAKCICDQCLGENSACNDDPGCVAIRACTARTGCRGFDDCYYGAGLCRDEIEKHGTTSLEFTVWQQLADCSANLSCSVMTPSACTTVATFECDGDEDCGAGKMCCARYENGAYDKSSCATTCSSLQKADAGPGGQTWSEMCHPGDSCATAGYSCLASDLLPSFLYRCRDTGTPPDAGVGSESAAHAVNCGTHSCGAGKKCCVRSPKAPYCAPVDLDCACTPLSLPDAGMMMMSMDDAGASDGG